MTDTQNVNIKTLIEKQVQLLAERSQDEGDNSVLCDLSDSMVKLARFMYEC